MVTITDDIIRNALNESIDEFILQENGLWNSIADTANRWNSSAKNWANKWGLDKAWNGVKNFAAAYMDKKTNGQWNKKYGIYVNGNGEFTAITYLEKWLDYHRKKLSNMISSFYGYNSSGQGEMASPSDIAYSNNRKNRFKGDPRYDPEEYLRKACTYWHFNKWVSQYANQWEGNDAINSYIENNITSQHYVKEALKFLDINAFYASDEFNEFKMSIENNKNWQEYFNSREQSGAYD